MTILAFIVGIVGVFGGMILFAHCRDQTRR